LRKTYEETKQSLSIPHRFQLSQIFIAQPADADAAKIASAQAKLQALLKKLHEPAADFAEIARSDSEDKASAAKGGEMGWLDDTKLPSLIRLRVIHLAKSAISEPIRINDGWHIVKCWTMRMCRRCRTTRSRESLPTNCAHKGSKKRYRKLSRHPPEANPVSIDDQELLRVQNITK